MKPLFIKEYTGKRLTWLSRLLIATLVLALFFPAILNLHGYLAPEQPPYQGLMVIEGWINDAALHEAAARYRTGNYTQIICTGTPIETGSCLLPFKSYPEMTADRLRKAGINPDEILVAIGDDVKKDRTRAAAIALRELLTLQNIQTPHLHLISVGPHGRRSHMIFQNVLGQSYAVGLSSLEDISYPADEWYKCSNGVRKVINELIAYTYALIFSPTT